MPTSPQRALPAELILQYESIAAASGRMLDAARSGAWEKMAATGDECRALIQQLDELEAKNGAWPDASWNRKRIRVLQRILRHDAEIRNLTQPWLVGLDQVLHPARLNPLARNP